MKKKDSFSKDEIYFLVFFSNFFIGVILLSFKYYFYSLYSFFLYVEMDPFPVALLILVFFCCIYYFIKIVYKRHIIRNFINFIKDNRYRSKEKNKNS